MREKIDTISIRELPQGIVPFKYVAEDLGVPYSSLRSAAIAAKIKFYKFADQVLCVNREEAINAWNNRPKAGRPWHKENNN